MALLLAILALNGLQYSVPSIEATIGPAVTSTFSLESPRGLNAWYCNFLLLLSGAASFQIYSLRQHRRDDYRGTYRVWLWFSALFVLSSVALVTPISDVVYQAFLRLAAPEGPSPILPAVVLFMALAVLVGRGYFEIRRSRLAVCSLSIAFLCYAGILLLQHWPALATSVSEGIPVTQGNLLLIAASSLLFGTLGFARYVYLEANGLIRAAGESESKAGGKSARAANKKADKAQKKSARKSKRNSTVDHSPSDSDEGKVKSDTDASVNHSQKSGAKASNSLLSGRCERNSGRSDNRVGSGQKLDQRSISRDSEDDNPKGLSKSELRRLRKQKRHAA